MGGNNTVTVLYIIDTFVLQGGAEKNLYQVVTYLDKSKYRPVIYCLWGGPMADKVKSEGIEVKDLMMSKIYGFKALVEGFKLYRFMKREKVRIVVTYHESSDFWGGVIAKLAGVPVILSSRRDMGFNLKGRHVLFYKLLNKVFSRILVVSDAVGRMIVKEQNADEKRIITLYNGIDTREINSSADKSEVRKSLGLPEGEYPVIGMLAGVRAVKGHRYFIEAAAGVLKIFPDARFIIVGSGLGHTGYVEELKTQICGLGIENRIILTGARRDAPAIQSVLDISVNCSLSEGFSNTILESMAAGKPVVATAVGGNPEAVVDGVTGILVPPADTRALAEGIIRLLKDKDLASRMGEAAARRINERFTQKVMMERTEKTYETLLRE
jgi:L-malate glycosyltransferase